MMNEELGEFEKVELIINLNHEVDSYLKLVVSGSLLLGLWGA